VPTTWLLRGARQLLTLRGPAPPRRGLALADLGVLAHGALLMRDGIIQEVGPARRIENLHAARYAQEIDAGGRVVLPAFVDPCVDPAGTAANEARAEASSRRAAEILLRHGTATFGAYPPAGAAADAERRALRMFRRLRKHAFEAVPFTRHAPAGPAEAARLRKQQLAGGLVLALARDAAAIRRDAAAAGGLLDLRAWAGDGFNLSSLLAALEARVLSVDGLLRATEHDARALAAVPATVVLLATQFAAIPPSLARGLLERGVALALGTGFGFAPRAVYSQQAVMERAVHSLGLGVEEAVSATTINAAHSTGVADRCGSLEPGKFADLLVLDCEDYREISYHCGGNLAHRVFKAGELAWSAV
jgi:imidazolonepropionase